MLRLKAAMKDCGLAQAELVRSTGYSKALVSRALSNGELPVDFDRFYAGVTGYVESRESLGDWLRQRGLMVSALFEVIGEDGREISVRRTVPRNLPVEIDVAIFGIAGRAVTRGVPQEETVSIAKVALFLLEQLRNQPMSMDELGEIEVAAGRLLQAGAGS